MTNNQQCKEQNKCLMSSNYGYPPFHSTTLTSADDCPCAQSDYEIKHVDTMICSRNCYESMLIRLKSRLIKIKYQEIYHKLNIHTTYPFDSIFEYINHASIEKKSVVSDHEQVLLVYAPYRKHSHKMSPVEQLVEICLATLCGNQVDNLINLKW